MRLAARHLPDVASLPRWTRYAAPLLVAALFAAIYAASVHDPDARGEARLLLLLPVALAAVAFGVRGGLAAAGVALALIVGWNVVGGAHIGLSGLATRAAVLGLTGAVLGWFVDARRRLEARVRRHYELSLDLLCTANLDGYFEWTNPAWKEVLGYSDEELRSKPFLEFVHPEDRESTQAEVAKLGRGIDTHNFRNRYRTAGGSYRWLEWNTRAAGRERRLYAAARDITVQKEAEEALDHEAARLESMVRERTGALEEARLETLQRLALAAEYRDDDTHEHTERVGRNAALIAQGLGLAQETVALIRHAAPLHDVGKLGIPDAILLKAGRLSQEELRLMQDHTTIGARILADPKFAILRMAHSIALNHHERWDGSGYKRGLRGDEIPLSGRIVAVADVFDALTHRRPYKKAWPLGEAVAEIERLAGGHFDPRVVGAFAELDHERLLEPAGSYDLELPPPPLRAEEPAPR